MPEPGTRSFDFEGHRLAYDERGEGDRVVLLTPGLLLPRRMQIPLAQRLAARGNRVINFDPLGHGESQRPHGSHHYSMSRFADQAVALLDHLGIEQAVFGGTSLGANVSLVAADRAPERVRGLVLEMPVLDDGQLPALMIFVPAVLAFRYASPLFRPATLLARALPRGSAHLVDVMLDWWSQDPAHAARVIKGLSFGPTAPSRQERTQIDAPALVIAHTMDPLHALADSQAAVRELPDARLTRARTFFEMRFAPGRLANEIADFVDECWAGQAGAARSGSVRQGPSALGALSVPSSHRRASRRPMSSGRSMASRSNSG